MAVNPIEIKSAPTRNHKVWLIGGTSESAELAQVLWAKKIPYVVTVTTPTAKTLYPPQAQVRVGALTPGAMATFAVEQNIRCILDASHPFASEVSQGAIALAQARPSQRTPRQTKAAAKQPIPYLRYERANIAANVTEKSHEAPSSSASFHTDTSKTGRSQTNTASNPDIRKITEAVTTVASLESLVESDLLHHQRVLFTLGYRHLAQFSALRPQSTLFARVLPSTEAIAGALSAGFSAHEIIALRPPISPALEKALWQQWQISRVVAKASGSPSGEAVKRQVAEQLGIQLILIQRPLVAYPQQTDSVKEAIAFCTQTLKMY